jgi:hypothetical protein
MAVVTTSQAIHSHLQRCMELVNDPSALLLGLLPHRRWWLRAHGWWSQEYQSTSCRARCSSTKPRTMLPLMVMM